jgi:hypothetical protein
LAQPVEKCANGAASSAEYMLHLIAKRLSAVWRDFEKVKVESVVEEVFKKKTSNLGMKQE